MTGKHYLNRLTKDRLIDIILWQDYEIGFLTDVINQINKEIKNEK